MSLTPQEREGMPLSYAVHIQTKRGKKVVAARLVFEYGEWLLAEFHKDAVFDISSLKKALKLMESL